MHLTKYIFLLCGLLSIFQGCNNTIGKRSIELPRTVPCECYEVDTDKENLDSNIIAQIDYNKPNFKNIDFLYCILQSDSIGKYLGMYSCFSEIHINPKLLNSFLYVFTPETSDSVLGYIKQNAIVSNPINYFLVVKKDDIREILPPGNYDLYVFQNETLLAKGRYTLFNEIIDP